MNRIVPLKGRGKTGMMRGLGFALVLAGCAALQPGLRAQNPAGGIRRPLRTIRSATARMPASVANPFPEDTSTVPVLAPREPGAAAQGSSDGSDTGSANQFFALPSEDSDPVHSPDDPALAAGDSAGESSSLAGVDVVEPVPDSDQPEKEEERTRSRGEGAHPPGSGFKRHRGGQLLPGPQGLEGGFIAIRVGDGAWTRTIPRSIGGWREAERNLGRYAEARKNFETLLDYDPDGKHGKQVRKLLKDPALAAAPGADAGPGSEAAPK